MQTMKNFTTILSTLAVATVVAAPVHGGVSPQTDSFDVTASVQKSCRIVSTTDIAFGTYDPADIHFSTALDADGALSVRCVKGVVADVALDQGLNPDAGSTCVSPLRQMSDGGAEVLRYDVYQDSARTSVWGCDATTDQSFTAASSNTSTTLTTYGRVPAGQDVAVGSYIDTVTVTVTF
jgi:spore coat protein U-like protein